MWSPKDHQPQNQAAWIRAPKGDLEIGWAETYEPGADEVLIKNEAICIQPFDAKVRKEAYMPLPYPFILGNNFAGTVVGLGEGVKDYKVGDRVVTSTPTYLDPASRKWGGWQKFAISKAGITTKIGDAELDQALAIPFALSTAVSALHVHLGMERPGEVEKGLVENDKVLIWGAGGAVGGYALQYAKSVGYTVIVTASPRAADNLHKLGATQVLDYKAPDIESQLRGLGPFKFVMTASGDPTSQKVIGNLLQPAGGKFASTLGGEIDLPSNVERVYLSFEATPQRPEYKDYATWWYKTYLPAAIQGGVEPAATEQRSGGLRAIQAAGEDVLSGRTKKKIILNPQD